MKTKKTKSMDELSKGYEKFINGKEVKKDGKSAFDKVIKKATKQCGSK